MSKRTMDTLPDTTPVRFTVKNLVAEEMKLEIGPGMITLGDLRCAITRRWDLPLELQRMVCSGRRYDRDYSNETPLTQVLRGTSQEDGHERIIFLQWMRGDDYVAVYRGGLIEKSELAATKRRIESQGQAFEAVTMRAWIVIFRRMKEVLQPDRSEEAD